MSDKPFTIDQLYERTAESIKARYEPLKPLEKYTKKNRTILETLFRRLEQLEPLRRHAHLSESIAEELPDNLMRLRDVLRKYFCVAISRSRINPHSWVSPEAPGQTGP